MPSPARGRTALAGQQRRSCRRKGHRCYGGDAARGPGGRAGDWPRRAVPGNEHRRNVVARELRQKQARWLPLSRAPSPGRAKRGDVGGRPARRAARRRGRRLAASNLIYSPGKPVGRPSEGLGLGGGPGKAPGPGVPRTPARALPDQDRGNRLSARSLPGEATHVSVLMAARMERPPGGTMQRAEKNHYFYADSVRSGPRDSASVAKERVPRCTQGQAGRERLGQHCLLKRWAHRCRGSAGCRPAANR